MLTKLLTAFSLFFLGNFVSCQFVTISAPATINYQMDKLKFICSPTNVQSSTSLASIALKKNTSTGYSEIVKVFVDISSGQVVQKVKWFQNAVRNRATVITALVTPTDQARLEFDINATQVLCSDEGTYQCSIFGTTSDGQSITSTAVTSVSMKVEATSINQIQAIPPQPEGVYNPFTEVQLSCTGTVGNPPKDLRWCYRRSSMDNSYLGLSDNIGTANQGTAFPQDCQYSRTSVLVYNVSSDFDEIEFRCETRYDDSIVCGHSSVIAANYTIKRFISATNTGGQGGEDTASGGVIAGAVIGSFVGVVLIVIIVYFVAFRKKNEGETYRTKEENGTGTAPIDNSVYSVPNKDRNGRDRNSPRDKKHYENRGLDEPHTRGYNQDPRGRSNPAMQRSFDDVRGGHNMMPSSGPVMGSNASFGSAV